MLLLLAATIVSAAILWGARLVSVELVATRDAAIRSSTLEIVKAFAPAIGAAAGDPRAVLVWEPLARTARQLFPEEFALQDVRLTNTAYVPARRDFRPAPPAQASSLTLFKHIGED